MRIIEQLKEDFSNDELKKTIEFKDKLKNNLYPDFLNELIVDETYKTQDVSKMLGKSDANLRYYLRELDVYIEPLKTGRSYRLTYKSIFKLHMVVLLINNGYLLDDILVKLGLKFERLESREQAKAGKKYDDDTIEQILFSFKQQLDQSEKVNKGLIEYMNRRFLFYEKLDEIKSHDYEIKLIDEKIERVQINLNYHRMERKRHKQNILMLKNEKNNGFISSLSSFLKKKDHQEIEKQYEKILTESENIEEDAVEVSLKDTINELKELKQSTEKERTNLVEETVKLKEQLKDLNSLLLLEEKYNEQNPNNLNYQNINEIAATIDKKNV